MGEPYISIVVPVYRSLATLRALHDRVVKVIEPIDSMFELLLVEDCGGDGSWEVIRELAKEYPRVRGIQMARNFGQHNALLCGIRAANGKIIVTIDDDLQNPPEEIPKLLSKLEQGDDVVYGSPECEQHGFLRNIASQITKIALQSTMGAETARKTSAFRAFKTQLRNAFENYRSPAVNIDVLLTWGTTRFASVKVKHDVRYTGESGYNLRKLVTHAFNMVTGFSTMPLQMASIMGFLVAALGVVILIFVVGRYFLFGTSVPGFSFLASIITIFSGAQLLALGIFGEYLARMHFRSMEMPPYVVSVCTDDLLDVRNVISENLTSEKTRS